MSKQLLSIILAISIGVTTVAVIQIKPWQRGQPPAALSGEAQDQDSQDPLDQPLETSAGDSGQKPGGDPSGEDPDRDPSNGPDFPADSNVPLGELLEGEMPVEPLLPVSSGSGPVKLSTRIFTIQFETNGGSPIEALQIPEGTRLGGLPVPFRTDSIFMGWYYDADLKNRVSDSHVIRSNLTLYAQYTNTAPLQESETPRAATALDQPQSFTFIVVAPSSMSLAEVKSAILAKNLNNPNETGFFELSELKDRPSEGEIQYVVSGRKGLFAAGATYKFTLEDERLRYAGYGESVRDFNFTTSKPEVMNLSLNEDLVYIPVEEIDDFKIAGQDSGFQSIPLATTNLGTIDLTSGSFEYDRTKLAVGQTVAIYKGVRPDQRSINDDSSEGEVAYVKITAVQGSTCQFVNAAADDVLFTPDILPLNRAEDQDDDPDNDSVTVAQSVLDFSSGEYSEMGLDDETTVDVGDFLALYTGSISSSDNQASYGQILSVELADDRYTIGFKVVSLETLQSVMDLYDNRGVSGDSLLAGVDIEDLEESIEMQARESGFAEEAATYLAALTLETEEFTTLQGDFDLSGYNILLDDGTPLSPGDMHLMSGSKVEVEVTELKATINKRLIHFEGLDGLRCTLKVGIEITISTGEENQVVIGVSGYFEQEVRVAINASGGAVWKWWGIFPYIDEYRLNANIDLYEYTGIQIEATITSKEKDEELDENDAGENLAKQLKDLLDTRDKYVGDDEATVADGLNEKYAAMLENESDWVELFSQKIFEQEGSVDPFHVLVYSIELKFVVSANMNISIGCDFYYENAKRYNYSIGVFKKTCTTETIDLVEERYEFTFYVMGTMGLRAGIKFEIKVGLFSTDLGSLGIAAEVGAYLRVWGYFYYELTYTASQGRTSKSSGALYFELGIYLEISFEAQAFKGTFSYNPTLYENEWPLWSAGARENVQAFAEMEEEITDISLKKHIQTFEIPDTLFTMSYLDLKTGETGEGFYDDAKSFKIEITNEAFSYDPNTNLLKLTPDGDPSETADMVITWIQAPLVFTSEPIQRTIQLNWDNYNDGYAIVFHSRGGSAVPMILKPFKTKISAPTDPVYPGYDFGGWYRDEALTKPYQVPETMPNEDVQVYAKWIPRSDTAYRVDHYQQNLGNSLYTLVDSVSLVGTTDSSVPAPVKDYPGFRAPADQKLFIQADGRAVQNYYYSRNRYQLTFAQGEIENDLADWVYSLKYGEAIVVPQMAAAGYDFVGWVEAEIPKTMPAANQLFTAQWSPGQSTPYRVEHHIQNTNGTGYTLQTAEYLTGETEATLALTDLCYQTDGITYWHGTVNGQIVDKTIIAKTGKLVIKLYYNRVQSDFITVLDSDRTTVASYYYEALVREPALPTKDGYTFSGWYVDESLLNPASFASLRMPPANLVFYGRMIANQDTAYQVEHYVEQTDGTFLLKQTEQKSGTTDTEVSVSDLVDDSLVIPGGISYRDGQIGGQVVDDFTIVGDGSVVVKLYYVRSTYQLTFVFDNGQNPVTSFLRFQSPVVAPAQPQKTGYTFKGWDRPLAESILTDDLTYTAQWVPRSDTPYTVKHIRQNLDDTYPDDGLLVETESLTGTTLDETQATSKTYPGFTAAKIVQSPIDPDGSTIVTIHYARNRHDVTWKTDENTIFATTSFRYGEVITVPSPAPVKQGYVLAAWTGLMAGATLPDEVVSYVAHWQPATDTTYGVRHEREALDGTYSIVETETMSGTTESLTAAKAKTYPGFTAAPITQTAIAADGSTIVTIQYKRNSYTLTWRSEGQVFKTEELKFESPLTVPEKDPVKTGYHLSGWGAVAATMPASNTSYNAVFAGNEYEVTFEVNGGIGDSIQISQIYGDPYVLPETIPLRPGYAFNGWFTDETAGVRIDSNTLMRTDSDQTLYAQWVPGTNTPYTVKHYQQNLTGDSYTLIETEIRQGVTGGETLATAKTYAGFSAQSITQQTILGDESTVVEVHYSRNTYRLTFKPYNGQPDQVSRVLFGSAIVPPSDLAKTGYVFAGWNTAPAKTMPDSDLVYTAKWTARTFNVTLDPAGGESAEQSLTVTYDSTYGAMPTPSRTGYTFAGWFTAATGGSEVLATEIVSITADQTLYAQWTAKTYTITFDSNGGTTLAVNQKTVTYGSVYGDMPVPEKTGYTCSGWFTAKSGGIPISSTDTVAMTADQTVYAQWSANSYWVSFNGNGATSGTMISQSLRYDAATKLKANSYIRLGYEFAGWAKTDSGSVVYADQASVSNLTAAANATVNLYAQWRQVSYSLQFNSAGGSAVSPQTGLHYGDSISAPTTTRTGYDFIGWFTDSTLLNKMTWTTMPAENLTLTAGWKLIDYSVTYVLYGGINHTSNPDIYTVTSQEITLGAPTRTGYTFGGWHLDAAFTKPVAGAAIPAGSTGNRTFYAQWTPVSYSIDYRDLNGMTHNNPTSYTIENSFDLKDPSVRTGYDFGGWYETYNYSGTPVTQIVAGSTGNKTYYAKWNIKSYTVTYSMDLGTNSADNPSAYTIESAAITLADPSRTGYAFAGWHTDEMLASKVSDVAIPTGSTGNRIFYAKWTPLEYEIQYNLDGGTNSSSNLSTYTIETSDLVLQAPSRQGYTFGGWHRSSDFSGSPVLSIPKGSTGSVTLYAKWSKDIYQINYALDGATNASANPATYTVDSATITLQSPTKGVDDIFLGWYANSSFTGAIVTEIPTGSTGDLYLYAKIVNYGKFSVANTSGSTFTISRTGGTYGPQIVTYRTQNGSAIRGTHFTAVSGSVTFAAGEITKTVTVTELGVTSQFSTYVATSYTNADRTYFFDLVNVAGGGKLDSTNRATRIMTRNSNYEVNAAYLNDYKQIASKTADLQVKEAPDGYGYNATISAGLSSSVLPSSVYSSYLQTYIKATASKMKIQLKNFSGKDGNTLDVNDWGWRMWRYVLFNNHEQGVSFSGDKTGAIPNLPDGTKHVLVYGITDNVDNRDNYSVNLPGPTGALSASGTTHAVSIAYTMRAADQDSNSYVLYNFADTCGISVGGYNSAGANSSWRYSGGSLYASPKDTTEPKLIGVAPMASNSYSFGDKVVVSLVFDEIVNSASSVSISTLYSNTPLTLKGGLGTNILYFEGTVGYAEVTTTPSMSNITINNQSNILDLVNNTSN